jgi:hypothetical protein
MTQTTIPTLQEILEKYKKAFLEKLEWHCNVYKVMGSGTFESPMWFQYRGDPGLSDPNLIEFASSQVGIQFLLPIEEADMGHFHTGNYHRVYDYFRTLKYKHIQEHHPTIWKELR